jgi:hypothetical protein
MQKTLFRYPAAPLDQLAVHDGDLPRGPAEADATQLQPEPECLAKRNGRSYLG